jgi:CheY-like chemotaxis protein
MSARRVLIVDDDDSIRDFIKLALADDGYEVATANNGEDALSVAASFAPSVILLDIRMPGMDGWKFSRAYHKTPPPHASIVVLTAARDPEASARKIKASAYLGKPFDLSDLMRLVARYTGRG